jgi:hypothetical protein
LPLASAPRQVNTGCLSFPAAVPDRQEAFVIEFRLKLIVIVVTTNAGTTSKLNSLGTETWASEVISASWPTEASKAVCPMAEESESKKCFVQAE